MLHCHHPLQTLSHWLSIFCNIKSELKNFGPAGKVEKGKKRARGAPVNLLNYCDVVEVELVFLNYYQVITF
jgi:hypothetical protein